MSRLVVDQLQGNAATGNKITIPAAHQLIAPNTYMTGHVLQVVQFSTTTQTSTSSTSFVATPLTATITPKSTASKILITTNMSIQGSGSGGVGFAIYRGATSIYADPNMYNGAYFVYANNWRLKVPLQHLDSPSTTSPTTYTIYMGAYGITGYLSTEGAPSNITLMEIGG